MHFESKIPPISHSCVYFLILAKYVLPFLADQQHNNSNGNSCLIFICYCLIISFPSACEWMKIGCANKRPTDICFLFLYAGLSKARKADCADEQQQQSSNITTIILSCGLVPLLHKRLNYILLLQRIKKIKNILKDNKKGFFFCWVWKRIFEPFKSEPYKKRTIKTG